MGNRLDVLPHQARLVKLHVEEFGVNEKGCLRIGKAGS
jgi:hypothetical protein